MPLKLSPTQIAFNARGDGRFNKPFQVQLDFFRQKLNLPTAFYDDILKEAHDHAFVVAGAQKADLLDDLRDAVDKAINEGESIGAFRKRFDSIVKQRGWQGWTGSDSQAGRDWRTRVIYRTNIATSYSAGRWKQLNNPKLLQTRPYWKYIHNDTVSHPRPLHVSWSGLVLRYDDPFWATHYPPNGWGCRCRITAVREKAFKGEAAPDNGLVSGTDRPEGIDFGWDYAPGSSVDSTQRTKFILNKIANLPKALADDFINQVAPVQFVPAKTIKAAEQFAVEQDLADFADYKGIKLEIANEMNKSLFEHIREFPDLRKNQRFIGTGQAQFAREIELKAAQLVPEINGDMSANEKLTLAKRFFKRRVMDPQAYAHSWFNKKVSGVAVNKNFAKDPEDLKKRLKRDVDNGFHPAGTASLKAVFDHEFGHQLDKLLKLRSDRVISELYKEMQKLGTIEGSLSRYAKKNIAEFIAEAWSEFKNNPQPGITAKTVGDRINEINRRKK